MSYTALKARIASGNVIILDGGTGTELERRGAAMNPDAWCATVVDDDPETLASVHRDYIESGAEIITTNTYASSRLMLEAAGLADRVDEINRRTDDVAIKARANAERQVWVAGSVSHMAPVVKGDQVPDRTKMPDRNRVYDAIAEVAAIHKECGCDFLLIEMLYDPDRIEPAVTAAMDNGLPVWAGLSGRRGMDGELLSYDAGKDIPFERIAEIAGNFDFEVLGVMHTAPNLISDTLDVVRKFHTGPLLAYPDSGYFKMPNWVFDDIIPPAEFADYARQWSNGGVQVIGGCCGLSPEHIRALTGLGLGPKNTATSA